MDPTIVNIMGNRRPDCKEEMYPAKIPIRAMKAMAKLTDKKKYHFNPQITVAPT